MKKILLILMILLLAGCYDYDELTDLAIVSTMMIDYKEDKYDVYLEIYETKKDIDKTSFFIKGQGKTFNEALKDIYNKTPKHVYYNHMNAVVIESSANKHLKDIYDYFIIDSDVRTDSYFLFTDDIEKLTKFETEDKLSIGETLKSIIKYNEKENGLFYTSKFREIFDSDLNDKNYIIGNIKIEDNVISLDKSYLLENDELTLELDKQAVLLYSIMNDNTPNYLLVTNDNTYEIYKQKLDVKVNKDKITLNYKVDVRILGSIKKNSTTYDDIKKIEEDIRKKIESDINDCLIYTKTIEHDIYNIDYLYYINYPQIKIKDIYKQLNYEVNVKVNLNEKGLMLHDMEDRDER